MDPKTEIKNKLTPFIFVSLLIRQGGCLPNEPAAHACWYYYMLAEKTREALGESTDNQIVYEGEQWMDTHYEQQRRSVCILYGLAHIGEIEPFWPYVRKQAERLSLPKPRMEYVRVTKYRKDN